MDTTDTQHITDSTVQLEKLTSSYSNYFNYPELAEQKQDAIKETTEQILAQLEELNALVETVKLNSETSTSLIPNLIEQSKKLEKTFEFIDSISEYVSKVNESVNQLEQRVIQVEEKHGVALSQKAIKLFSSFPGMKKENNEPPVVISEEETKKVEVDIIDSNQYFDQLRTKLTAKKE